MCCGDLWKKSFVCLVSEWCFVLMFVWLINVKQYIFLQDSCLGVPFQSSEQERHAVGTHAKSTFYTILITLVQASTIKTCLPILLQDLKSLQKFHLHLSVQLVRIWWLWPIWDNSLTFWLLMVVFVAIAPAGIVTKPLLTKGLWV